jgi:hypothetical protein
MKDHERDDELDPELREAVGRLPKSVEPPDDLWPGIRDRIRSGGARRSGGRRATFVRWLPLAAAAAFVVAVAWWLGERARGTSAAWEVQRVAGAPRVNDAALDATGSLQVGQWLETDDSSRAVITVGDIGHVDVRPGSRVRLVRASATDHRLALAFGSIHAKVSAPPRIFFVETPAGTATDLGCEYTLETDSSGRGLIHVTGGYVEFSSRERRSIVPLDAFAVTRPDQGPGMPYADDAPEPLRRALTAFDFERGGTRAARAALAAARSEDALSIWHLLGRADFALRGEVYDRLTALVPPPAGVSRERALALHAGTLERYWDKIRRIHFRRVILRGIRDVDARTGVAK